MEFMHCIRIAFEPLLKSILGCLELYASRITFRFVVRLKCETEEVKVTSASFLTLLTMRKLKLFGQKEISFQWELALLSKGQWLQCVGS